MPELLTALSAFSSGPQAEATISHDYTYIFTDLRSNAVLGELPLQSVSYSTKLSTFGEASGSIKVNIDTMQLGIKALTEPGKTGLYILRDGQPMWGGIIWKRSYAAADRNVTINAKTFESYFYHRIQNQTKYWASNDQLEIARWLVQSNGSAAALGITVSAATSTHYRERTMYGYEFKTTGLELEQLSALEDGFDWNVEITRDTNGQINRRLEFYYPFAGVSRDATQLFFEYPGSTTAFNLNEDADSSGNSIWVIGAGEGSEQVNANAQDSAQIAAGWPLIELTRSYKSVVRPSTLQSHANADRDRLKTPVTVFEVTVSANKYPALGTYNLGDWARFKLSDDFLTPALDTYARITGIAVTVDGASGVESVDLSLGGDEVDSTNDDSEEIL